MTPRTRRRLANLGLLFGSVLVALLVAEVVARGAVPSAGWRAMYQPVDDPELGYTLQPGADFEFDGIAVRIPPSRVRVSAQGHRGADVAIPKPPGIKRLVCLGDSFTFGWGVEAEESWCHRLGDQLGPGWEAINLGVPGYNSGQQVRLFETRALAYQPDRVLVMYNDTDLEPTLSHGDDSSVTAWLIDHSALARWLHIRDLLGGGGAEDLQDDGPPGAEPPAEPPAEVDPAVARELHLSDTTIGSRTIAPVLDAYQRLAALARQEGFRVAVLLYPDAGGRRPIIDVALGLGFGWVDLSAATSGAGLTIPGDGHPNAEGHRRLATQIHQVLSSWGWWTASPNGQNR